MSKIQQVVLEIVLTLAVVVPILALPSISFAEPVSTFAGNLALIGSTGAKPVIPEALWPLGMTLVSLVMMVRRKVA